MALEYQDRFEAAQSADGRYRMLVEAVTDYAIYMLDPTGVVTSWNPGARALQGLRRRRDHRRAFLPLLYRGGSAAGLPQRALETAGARRQVRERRLARAQGRQPLLGQRRHRSHPRPERQIARLRQGHARHDGARARLRPRCARARSSSGCSSRASPTTRSIMLDPQGNVTSWNSGRGADQGLRSRKRLSGDTSRRFYTEEDREAGLPEIALETARAEGRFEREGCGSARTARSSGRTS